MHKYHYTKNGEACEETMSAAAQGIDARMVREFEVLQGEVAAGRDPNGSPCQPQRLVLQEGLRALEGEGLEGRTAYWQAELGRVGVKLDIAKTEKPAASTTKVEKK